MTSAPWRNYQQVTSGFNPSSTIACRPNFGAAATATTYKGPLRSFSTGRGCPLGFPPLWLFCTSAWPKHVVTCAYNKANWGGGHEKVLHYRLFIGIGVKRCWLRGQRQVPGRQGKSSSASRRNEGLVSVERRAGPRGQARALCPKWVVRVISSERKPLPHITHLRTSRCTAAPLGDQAAPTRPGPPHGGSLENDADLDRIPRDVGGSALCGVDDALGERGVTVLSKRSCRSVYADSFELLAHSVGDGNLTTIGEQDRRAVRRVQREKLQPWLDLRHFREQRGDVFGADRLHVGDLPVAEMGKVFDRYFDTFIFVPPMYGTTKILSLIVHLVGLIGTSAH